MSCDVKDNTHISKLCLDLITGMESAHSLNCELIVIGREQLPDRGMGVSDGSGSLFSVEDLDTVSIIATI